MIPRFETYFFLHGVKNFNAFFADGDPINWSNFSILSPSLQVFLQNINGKAIPATSTPNLSQLKALFS